MERDIIASKHETGKRIFINMPLKRKMVLPAAIIQTYNYRIAYIIN